MPRNSLANSEAPIEVEVMADFDLPHRHLTRLDNITEEAEAVDETLNDFVMQESEARWRCQIQECKKLFISQHFWRKHAKNRHAEWFETVNVAKEHVQEARNDDLSEENYVQDDDDETNSLGSWQAISQVDEDNLGELTGEDKSEVLTDEDDERILQPTAYDYDAFFMSAECGDTEGLEVGMQRGVNIEAKAVDGYTALVVAIMEKHLAAVECLLENGADPHGRIRNLPPIVYAAGRTEHGPELLQLLLDYGANLNTISGPDKKNVLHWATTAGKADIVEFLIGKGMDIEKKCHRGCTPLILAAESGRIQVAEVLLKHGAKLSVRSDNGGTPLVWSASNEQVEAVEYWLEKGLEINAVDKNGLTSLFLASHFGSSDIVKLLLEWGADTCIKSLKPGGFTPLMAAAFSGRAEVVQILIEHGCDLEAKSAANETALDLAVMEGNLRAAQILLEAMSKGSYHPKDSVALQIALRKNYAETKALVSGAALMYPYVGFKFETSGKFAWMEWVLNEGGTLVKPKAMRRLLQVALEDKDDEMIHALAGHGCEMSAPLDSGHTPLSLAVQYRHVNLVKALLHAGADPNRPNAEGGHVPLTYAIIDMESADDTEIVDLLLNHGRCKINRGRGPEFTPFSYVLARVDEWPIPRADDLAMRMLESVKDVNNDRCSAGTTLLHVAVLRGREDFVDILLRRGAKLEAVDQFGITPFLLACQHSPAMIWALYERRANIHATMKDGSGAVAVAAVADRKDTEALKMLIDIGLDANARGETGHTPLLCSLNWSREGNATYLIDQGVKLYHKTNDKQLTALHLAARHGLDKVVEKLLQRPYMDVNAKSTDEWTPLHEACYSGSPKIVKMLLHAGANIELALPNKDRPLHIALINEKDDVAELLLQRGADITARASKNRTPLHLAAAYDNFVSARILLDKGVSMEDMDEDTHTPLCCSSSYEITKMLIERGAKMEYADNENWTPLHQAVYHTDIKTCRVLLVAGADMDTRTSDDGLNVMERAMETGDVKERETLVRMLREVRESRKKKKVEAKRNAEKDRGQVLVAGKVMEGF